jgi:uncharacterized membrane protein
MSVVDGAVLGLLVYATRPSTVATSLELTDETISACAILRGDVVSRRAK